MITKKTDKQAYWNWFLLSLFYSYQYLLRVYPSTFTNEIRGTFGFSAQEFATLTTYCIFVYSCLQIPFGILLDRVGIRWLILSAFGLCLVGQYIFTHAQSAAWARCGRIMVGIGSAPAFMSAVKMTSDAFSEKLCGIFIGITCTFGIIFLMVGNTLLKEYCLRIQDWQTAAQTLNVVGMLLFVLCLLSLSTHKSNAKEMSPNFWQACWSVVTNYHYLGYALLTICTCSIVTTLSDLWGNTFLITKFHLSDMQAVLYNQFTFAGFLIGATLIPALFRENTLRGVRVCSTGLIILFILLIYGPDVWPSCILQLILFFLGLFGCADILCFTLAAQSSTPQTSGFIVGWMNTINMLGLTLLQACVAHTLDSHWSGLINDQGLRVYQTHDYELALGVLLNVAILGLFTACLMRSRGIKTAKH